GDDHVIDADRQASTRGKAEAKHFDFVEHLDRYFQPEAQVGVVHQSANALLLEQAVDVRHTLGQLVVQDRATDRRVDECTLDLHRVRVDNVLIVVRSGQIDQVTAVAQANRRQGFDFTGIESHQHFLDVG